MLFTNEDEIIGYIVKEITMGHLSVENFSGTEVLREIIRLINELKILPKTDANLEMAKKIISDFIIEKRKLFCDC